jgi:hypothetical protein
MESRKLHGFEGKQVNLYPMNKTGEGVPKSSSEEVKFEQQDLESQVAGTATSKKEKPLKFEDIANPSIWFCIPCTWPETQKFT